MASSLAAAGTGLPITRGCVPLREVEMKRTIAIAAWVLLLALSGPGRAQTSEKYYFEPYAFFGRRTSTPGTDAVGVGGDIFVFKGLAVSGDVGTTIRSVDDKMTIWSGGAAYHFLCCNYNRRFEPYLGAGYGYLSGNINAHGRIFPWDPGDDRTGHNFNQGLIVWPIKHVGARIEIREYRFFVSYGALENVIPGGNFEEFRVALTLR